MPTVSPDSPSENTPFESEESHVRAHRALERAIESIDTAGSSTTGTTSTNVLIANRVGFGGAVPSTSSTAAPIKGIFRTAAVVGKAVGWAATNSVYVATFSVETQIGNAIQPGDPVMVLSETLPTNAVQMGATCTATNTISVGFFGAAGGINTTTVSFHVFTFDTT